VASGIVVVSDDGLRGVWFTPRALSEVTWRALLHPHVCSSFPTSSQVKVKEHIFLARSVP